MINKIKINRQKDLINLIFRRIRDICWKQFANENVI